MPAPATNDELLEVIRKSGVADDARLKTYLGRLAAGPDGLPDGPTPLAEAMVRDGVLTFFQADQLLQGKWKRFFIGKYKVLERLGVGGMGQVFLCEHKLMKRRVAVKVLPAAKAADEAALGRFYREARAVAAVDHPNIVRAYDIDQDDNLHFIVMEFVDGANFHDLVKRHGPMDILRACHYLYGAAVGLHHAHEMGLVHRDIKPANILVDRSGVVKILDMGLARFFHPDDDDHLTKKFDENVLGTADYLAPEQAIDSSGVDIRADIYGLGGTFYYMLTGSAPYPDGTVAQKLLWHQTKPPKPARDIRPDIPPPLAELLDKMLAKDPADRFQTPAELMAALAPWVQTPIPPPPEHEMPQLSAAASTGFGGRTGGTGSGAPLATTAGTLPTVNVPPRTDSPPTQPALKPAVRSSSVHIPALPASATHGVTAKPVTATATAEGPAVWESIATDTLATAHADTAKSARRPRPAAKPARDATPVPVPAAPRKKSLLPWIVAAAVGLTVILAGAAATVYYVVRKPVEETPGTTPAGPRPPKKWYVSANAFGADPAATRKTIREAMDSVRSGDTITILDDQIEVPPTAFGYPKQKVAVHIEAGNAAKSVVWKYKPPPGAAKQTAALELTNLEDSTIDGIVFDLGGQIDVGVKAQGQFAGTVFQNVTVKGARKVGVQLSGVETGDGRPLKLSKVRVVQDPADKAADAGIEIAGGLSGPVEIADCRLEGGGKGSGLRIEGNAGGITFRNNRVFKWDSGVFVAGGGDKAKTVGLRAENNTFYQMKTAGIAAEAAVALPGRTAWVGGNLFVNSGDAFRAPGTSDGVTPERNGTVNTKEGNTPLKTEAATGFNNGTTNPAGGDEFLRGTNHSRPTAGKVPVGIE